MELLYVDNLDTSKIVKDLVKQQLEWEKHQNNLVKINALVMQRSSIFISIKHSHFLLSKIGVGRKYTILTCINTMGIEEILRS